MGGERSLQLENAILRAYENGRDCHSMVENVEELKQMCRDCHSQTIMVTDRKSGDRICMSCGVVCMQHERVDSPYGRGVGGYSNGSVDGLKLDLMTGAKAIEGGRTRKYYKTILKRVAGNEIDGLVHDENIRETSKIMFARFTDKLDVVRNRDKVIRACVAAAESRARRYAKQGHDGLKFRCGKCQRNFTCKKDRRFHTCVVGLDKVEEKSRKKKRKRRHVT